MAEPDPNAAPQPPAPEDDGGFRVKVLLAGIAVLFVLVCVLVATRERGVNKKAEAPFPILTRAGG